MYSSFEAKSLLEWLEGQKYPGITEKNITVPMQNWYKKKYRIQLEALIKDKYLRHFNIFLNIAKDKFIFKIKKTA